MQRPDREQRLAKTALGLMSDCGVIPTPENFELFYAYTAGENPAVTQAMRPPIEQHRMITPEFLADTRLRCLSSARAAHAMDGIGSGMSTVIAGLLGKLEAVGRQTADYSSALSAANGELAAGRSPADLRRVVESLLAATHAMESRTRALEGELQRSSAQVTELRNTLDDVRKESLTDPLTSLANRKAFDTAMDAAIAREPEEGACLLLCDIDHFKKFNDQWGHQTGDQVLRLVANCLKENVKGRDTAARYGGEEFAVLLRGASLADAVRVADQIRLSVQGRKLVKKSTGDVLGTITISIGVAQFRAGEPGEPVIRRADACLYGAKQNGRNLVMDEKDSRIAVLESSAA